MCIEIEINVGLIKVKIEHQSTSVKARKFKEEGYFPQHKPFEDNWSELQ